MTLYVDGTKVQPHHGDVSNWGEEKIFLNIEPSFETIAIKCVDTGGLEGILASLKDAEGKTVLVTNSSWKCYCSKQVEIDDWTPVEVVENSGVWKQASTWNRNIIGSISKGAQWIWCEERSSGDTTVKETSFCHFTRPRSKILLIIPVTDQLNSDNNVHVPYNLHSVG